MSSFIDLITGFITIRFYKYIGTKNHNDKNELNKSAFAQAY